MNTSTLPSLQKLRSLLKKLSPENCGYVNCHQLQQFEINSWPLESLNELLIRDKETGRKQP